MLNCKSFYQVVCFMQLSEAPSDFYLSPKLKLFLAGQRFSSNQDAIAAVEGYFCRSYEEPLQGQHNSAGASLE
jgi:hypothetical protein